MTEEPSGLPDFAGVYDRHFSRIYNYVRYRLLDAAAADDVVSRVFERALEGLEGFDLRRGPVEAWLFGIARNAVADHFRAGRRAGWLSIDAVPERRGPDPRAEDRLADDEDRRALLAALCRLDERERELLALKFGARMSHRAIADHLGLGESHVGVLVFRAVKKLQAALGGGG